VHKGVAISFSLFSHAGAEEALGLCGVAHSK